MDNTTTRPIRIRVQVRRISWSATFTFSTIKSRLRRTFARSVDPEVGLGRNPSSVKAAA
ncbi:MAG: hypothetical protein ACYDAQ_06850 [Mycobacteriales bacterium]